MSVWAAITLTLAASACMNLGLVLQKKGLLQGAAGSSQVRGMLAGWAARHPRRPIWYAGMALLVGGYAVYAWAMSARAAPISLLQPLSASGLLVVALLAVVYLNERFDALEWCGVVLMLAGVILLGFSAEETPPSSVGINVPRLLIYLSGTIAAAAAVIVAARRASQAGRPARAEFLFGVLAGLLLGTGYLYTKIFSLAAQADRYDLGVLSGICIALGLGIGFVVLQMGFRRGRALIVTAVNLVTNQVLVVAGGLFCLGERFPNQTLPFAARIAGLAGIFAGIILLARLSATAGSGANAAANVIPIEPNAVVQSAISDD